MATRKSDEPEQPTIEPVETARAPSKHREAFLAGEIGWNEYVKLESATEPEAETKPASKGK